MQALVSSVSFVNAGATREPMRIMSFHRFQCPWKRGCRTLYHDRRLSLKPKQIARGTLTRIIAKKSTIIWIYRQLHQIVSSWVCPTGDFCRGLGGWIRRLVGYVEPCPRIASLYTRIALPYFHHPIIHEIKSCWEKLKHSLRVWTVLCI